MARPLRLEFRNALYHVTSRGDGQGAIYKDDTDRERCLDVLAGTVERFNWRVHAYCLMGNHYHLLVETPEANLAQGMRHFNGVYTQRYNRRHRRVRACLSRPLQGYPRAEGQLPAGTGALHRPQPA